MKSLVTSEIMKNEIDLISHLIISIKEKKTRSSMIATS